VDDLGSESCANWLHASRANYRSAVTCLRFLWPLVFIALSLLAFHRPAVEV
ncbi:hypothetical protein AAULR_25096, partial [Lacticaseibacillus rhamnosus MTCC 5462]